MTYSKKPLVGIIMGSSSDSKVMHSAAIILDEFGLDMRTRSYQPIELLQDY
ncbi:N5-carboxyaminoimidazole ribonucleotide mutase [Candidatus Nitrosotalea sp. TS]|nr:N5-carboxyaminoimidazole ribonucleotide mutase [Candidatus Nitrosotalea sp. TS]